MSNRGIQISKCINCYKCIRNCPVKAIKIKDERAYIIKNLCIGCGNCSATCSCGLKKIRSDMNKVERFLNNKEEIIAIVDPHVVADLKELNYKEFIGYLKKIGFKRVEENTIGYKIVFDEYLKYIKQNKQDIYISSMCPSIHYFITRYHANLIKYLMPFDTPTIAHAKKIRAKHKNSKIVLITCCISKKFESIEEKNKEIIDAVLTFDDIFKYMSKINVYSDDALEMEYDDRCNASLSFSREIDKKIINASSIDNIKDFLKGINEKEITNVFANLSTCTGHCFGGFGYKNKKSVFYRENIVTNHIYECNDKKSRFYEIDIRKNFKCESVEMSMPTEEEIRAVLVSIGKKTQNDELDCGVCGYDTCRDKAIAVCRGYAEPFMCMPYIKDKNQDLSTVIFEISPNYIVIVGDDFKIIDINDAMLRAMNKTKDDVIGDYIGDYIDVTNFIDVFYNQEDILNKKSHWVEFEKELLGNIVYLHQHRVAIAIYNDITNEENQKKKFNQVKINTINTAQNVIEKQMRVAQEIASLLGETTAETKVVLTRLKELAMKGDD